MIYLSDNDIAEKLAVCDLINEALAALGASPEEVRVIPTLKGRVGGRSRAKAERRLGADAVARLLGFLDRAGVVDEVSPEDQATFDDVLGIDAGEAILLSSTRGLDDFLLLTGDKKCLRALVDSPECRAIAERVRGCVVCFEQVILRVIARSGFDLVRSRVVPALHCDNALRAAFGSGMDSTEPNAVGCLRGYVGEMRGLRVDLLAPDG